MAYAHAGDIYIIGNEEEEMCHPARRRLRAICLALILAYGAPALSAGVYFGI